MKQAIQVRDMFENRMAAVSWRGSCPPVSHLFVQLTACKRASYNNIALIRDQFIYKRLEHPPSWQDRQNQHFFKL